MVKFILRILSTACIAAFILYLKEVGVYFDKRFWILLSIFLIFGTISMLQGAVMGGLEQ